MNTTQKTLLATGLVASLHSFAVEIKTNGFASVVAGKTFSNATLLDGSDASYLVNPIFALTSSGEQNTKASYDNDISFTPDTNIGLQMTADLGHNLSVTAQLTAHGANDFNAEFEWAYVSYQFNSEWTINAGRQRVPFYMYSDYLDVAYAYHWLRAPVEVYGEYVSTFEGVSVNYSSYFGDWEFMGQGYYGAKDQGETPLGYVDLEGFSGLVLELNNDWLRLRGSYHTAEMRMGDGTNAQFSEENPEQAHFASIGAMANWGDAFIGGEVTQLWGDEPLQLDAAEAGIDKQISWMLTAGYRIGDFTPHVTYAQRDIAFISGDFNGDGSVLPVFTLFDDQHQTNAALTFGVRWDFHSSAALKAEYTSSTNESDDIILMTQGKTNEADVFALGVDLVF